MTLHKRQRRLDVWVIVSICALLMFIIFLVYPMFGIMRQSIIDPATGEYSSINFYRFFERRFFWISLVNSLRVTSWVTIVSAVLGTMLAFILSTVRIRGRAVLDMMIVLSMISPPFIGAYSWILLLGRNGVITNFLNDVMGINFPSIYGFTGILLVVSLSMTPIVYLYVKGALKNMDTSLYEASEGFGCAGFLRFFKIVIPLIAPTIIASALLVFMNALADFGTPMLIGEGFRTMPVLIFNQFMAEIGANRNFAAAMSLILMAVTLLVFLVQQWITVKTSYTMNAYHPLTPVKVKGIKNIIAYLFCYLTIGIMVLPQLVIIYTAFRNTSPTGVLFRPGYSLDSFRRVFTRMGDAIFNTITYASLAVFIIVIMGLLISYVVVRRPGKLNTALDALSMAPFVIPGSVLGIAIAISFRSPVRLTGTAAAIVLVFVIRRLPFMIRSISAMLRSISMSTEEAGISLGASHLKVFAKITVPILTPGIISGSIMTWMQTTSELSASIMLYVARTRTLTIAIYTEVIRGQHSNAAALSVVYMAISVICLLIFFRLTGSKDFKM